MKSKKISVKVKNKELDALEDLLTMDYEGDEKKKEKHRKLALNLWARICKEYDNIDSK